MRLVPPGTLHSSHDLTLIVVLKMLVKITSISREDSAHEQTTSQEPDPSGD